MTEAQINRIKGQNTVCRQLQQHRRTSLTQLDALVASGEKVLAELSKSCDHRMPDGSSADDGGFMYGSCKICGAFDI